MPRTYHPCIECGEQTRAVTNHPRTACCDPCRLIRRREGRNRVEVACRKCSKRLFPEARQVGSWDGFCPPCRRELREPPTWPDFKKVLEPLPRGLRPILEPSSTPDPWKPVNTLEDLYCAPTLAYVANRPIKLQGRQIDAGDTVIFNGTYAIVGCWKIGLELSTLKGAVTVGWLDHMVWKLPPNRFQREDAI